MELDTNHIRLDCAALHLARDVYADLDLGRFLSFLDELAEEVADLRPGLSAIRRYDALREVLVARHGFRGDEQDYYDPRNSYLNDVLDRHRGIPISLAVVWIEVARRLKWPVAGVGMPGHFLVRVDDAERFVLADPFNSGQSLSVDECARWVNDRFDEPIRFSQEMLKPVDSRYVLGRMLKNLRQIHLLAGDWGRLRKVLQRLCALEPQNGQHLQDLASVFARQGDVRGAYRCLRLYLRREPDAQDSDMVEYNLARLEAALTALN
jgi:regulator of sirC expression with transglutaminase-like and TPR domain